MAKKPDCNIIEQPQYNKTTKQKNIQTRKTSNQEKHPTKIINQQTTSQGYIQTNKKDYNQYTASSNTLLDENTVSDLKLYF